MTMNTGRAEDLQTSKPHITIVNCRHKNLLCYANEN